MMHSAELNRNDLAERQALPADRPWYVRVLANQSSVGFNAGDANLYRYVGNCPTTATDPSGLWVWRLDEKGKVFAVSQEGDTLNDLINQGYNEQSVAKLGKASGINDTTVRIKAGIELDITDLLPKGVQDVLARQQQLSYEKLRSRVEQTPGGPKNIPKGKTVGNCGVDWFQGTEVGDDGLRKKGTYHDAEFGWANCYGFVALLLGYKLPTGCSPEHFQMGGLKSEGVWGATEDKAQTYNPFQRFLPDERYERVRVVIPEGGLIKTLTSGMKPTDKPGFGAVALFSRVGDGVTHAGMVLGRNQRGHVFIIQKLNIAEACGISTTTHPRVAEFGKLTFYQK